MPNERGPKEEPNECRFANATDRGRGVGQRGTARSRSRSPDRSPSLATQGDLRRYEIRTTECITYCILVLHIYIDIEYWDRRPENILHSEANFFSSAEEWWAERERERESLAERPPSVKSKSCLFITLNDPIIIVILIQKNRIASREFRDQTLQTCWA
eukprot:scaffold205382_cov33-Tisochrysis_lutea.AAC.2